ncbi:MAG: NAD(P)/FAD-dependent oxidoreductase [Bacteroidetes bacterium]|nr:NAD(P)/FAD-dependent oxidoreductase [Bacteroidota bacterium]
MKGKTDFDAVVVGSGPNGLAAAIALQQKGLSVLLIEGSETIGGGMRSAELTLPGYTHDICSAIHPMAVGSPFFMGLPLREHGLEFVYPGVAAAHPFDDGSAAVLAGTVAETAERLGKDGKAYARMMEFIVRDWDKLSPMLLGPLRWPSNPLLLSRFGLKGLKPAAVLGRKFQGRDARGLLAGMAAHSIQPLTNLTTSAFALVLMAVGHVKGWPVPVGGASSIADALASYFVSLGGRIETGAYIRSMSQLPSSRALLLDLTPRQLLQLGGHKWSSLYQRQLESYRYGMGVFKIDWALGAPVPFTAAGCRQAGTVHIGGTMEEIVAGEEAAARGGHPEKPFVLFAQQSLFDPSRAPRGKHTAWAYCHVPNGSKVDRTEVIERQVERFAPGFRESILARHVYNTEELEAYNPNYIGGDINGGVADIGQLFTRPALRWSPYRTSEKGIYICSSATPPGGGVHGMCGWWAARRAMKDIFKIS